MQFLERTMAATLKQFTERLLASGLMTAEELGEFRSTLPARLRHPSVSDFCRELIQAGKLTSYQAQRLLEGKHAGLILGKNVILDCIGSGGMGEVYLAEHRRMKRHVVVKVLHPEHTQSETALKRFQREVEAAAKLYHPNIVTAFDADEENGIHFLVMEYVEGQDLGSLVNRDGPFPIDKALDCIIQAARGLEYAHSQGVIHRDIKPSNLLLDATSTIKVLDMGLARIDNPATQGLGQHARDGDDDDSLTQANQIVGTVDYMSPEQADNSMTVDRRSDIYSLGCTLYRLLVGKPPYEGESTIRKLIAHRTAPVPSLRATRKDVPERLDAVFQRMVAKLPSDRISSMGEVIREMECVRDELKGRTRKRSGAAGKSGIQPTTTPATAQSERAPRTDRADTVQVGDDTRSALAGAKSGGHKEACARVAVGIDLGTTYSAVAVLDELGRPRTLSNAEGDKITPSVLLFDVNEVIVGKEALKAMATEMEQIADCAKRDLGLRAYRRAFAGERFPPEALQAWILNKLRRDSWAQIGRFEKVVITVPAYFDEVRRKATEDAGYMAGFEVLDIINEPTAAAVAFGFQQGYLNQDGQPTTPQKIVVYDLGGGTFDVTVMEINGVNFATLATDGDVRLGGHDWDQRLVDYVAEEFIRRFGADPREDPNTYGRLWRECEDAKRTLSARTKTAISCEYRGHALRANVTREQFEDLTRDLLDRTAFTTEQTIRAAGLQWSQIDRVLLVGGSTRMPMVYNMLHKLSGLTPDCSVSPDEAVAQGAALHAGLLLDRFDGKSPRFYIRNVNSHSLGVAAVDSMTKRRQTAVLIPRNTALPVTAKRVFNTSKDGQRSVLVQIVEGESENPDDCVQIGRCAIHDLPANLPAHTPIEVRFQYNENGRLSVRVRVAGMDHDLQHELTRENTLTREQINAWRQRISGLPPPKQPSSDDSQSTQFIAPTSR